MRRLILLCLLMLVGGDSVSLSKAAAAVFQYCISAETDKGPRDAFLWIPAEAARIRGAVIGGMTLTEREFAKDEQIRRACADQQLAIVFLKCGLGSVDVQNVLDELVAVSGYSELANAPLMFLGHSAGGPQAKACAVRMADRCFGLVQYRGGVPGGSEVVPPGIPVLMMIGQFDEFGGTMRDAAGRETWQGGREALAAYRAADPRNLASIVVEPGAGHFAWSDRNATYLALFIRKAAAACIDDMKPGAITQIDYRTGWLTDLMIDEQTPVDPAPYEQYGGDKAKTAWHFDEEMALAAMAYHAGGFGKKDQFITWNDPYWVDAGTRFFFTDLKWVGDGQTFEVHPVYAAAYAGQYNGRGPKWLEVGRPVGHADAPIQIRAVSGPIAVADSNAFRVRHDALAPATEAARATFMAFSPGDAEYRYTEHVGMMPRGFSGLKKGAEQTITFPPIGDMKSDSKPVRLSATSSAGLPVEYYVAYGPATVDGGMLTLGEVPARAALPIEVKIVAWQFGSAVEPFVKTAAPVEQTVRIVK